MTRVLHVSVVIPTRNRAGMLLQTVRSVLAQDAGDQPFTLEVIVVDEGSTDDTQERLARLGDPRVHVLHHPTPKGLPLARNAGIAAATGDIVGFVDDDDLWLPHKLGMQLAALRRDRREWVFGGALTFSAGPLLHAVTPPPSPAAAVAELPYRNVVPGGGSNALVTRRALLETGGFHVPPRTVEDWDLWIRLAQRGAPSVVDAPVVAYRRHEGNMSRRVDAVLAGTREIDRRYRHLRGGAELDWVDLERWLARSALRAGDHRGAVRVHAMGVRRRHPGSVRRLVRSLVPVRPRPPVAAGDAPGGRHGDHLLDRWRSRRVVAWPEGVEAWLRAALAEQD